ncbi:NAD-dependent epimerase/dehydratase family protein [Enterobacter cloacae]
MAKYTIIGGNGFVGQAICQELDKRGLAYDIIGRNDCLKENSQLDKIIYCAGNGDCNNNPYDVFEANTNLLVKILKSTNFNRMVYLSSTRIYMNNDCSTEKSDLIVGFNDNRRLFNLTKLAAEEMLLRSNKDIVILRPSNIYGTALKSPLFLPSIIKDALIKREVNMYVDKLYAKDYVSVGNVAEAAIFFSELHHSDNKIINIASGKNVSANEIASILEKETGCMINWHTKTTAQETFPVTDNKTFRQSIPELKIDDVIEDMKEMIFQFKESINKGIV